MTGGIDNGLDAVKRADVDDDAIGDDVTCDVDQLHVVEAKPLSIASAS